MEQPLLCKDGETKTYLKAEGRNPVENKRLKMLARRIIDAIRVWDKEGKIKSTNQGVSLSKEKEQVFLKRWKLKRKCKQKIEILRQREGKVRISHWIDFCLGKEGVESSAEVKCHLGYWGSEKGLRHSRECYKEGNEPSKIAKKHWGLGIN